MLEWWNLGMMGLKKTRLKAPHTQSSKVPLFHHSMRLTKTIIAINTVIPISCRNSETFSYGIRAHLGSLRNHPMCSCFPGAPHHFRILGQFAVQGWAGFWKSSQKTRNIIKTKIYLAAWPFPSYWNVFVMPGLAASRIGTLGRNQRH